MTMQARSRASGRSLPEIEVKDGEVVPCWIGLVLDIFGAAGDADWAYVPRLTPSGGVQDGGPPCGLCRVRDYQYALSLIALSLAKSFWD